MNAALIGQWLKQASDAANPLKPTTTTQYVTGDVDLDGDVESTDLGHLVNNFGDTNGLGCGSMGPVRWEVSQEVRRLVVIPDRDEGGLAMHGHQVTIYDANKKPGGLNEYGIAAYKTVDGFAQHEVDYVTAIGGIDIQYKKQLGKNISLAQLRADHDAVFLGMGLAGVNSLGLKGKDPEGVVDAVDFISAVRQSKSLTRIPVGRRVVVIGGGMTAIDAAVQAKLLGAEEVTICYRRGQENMNASDYEQALATSHGVIIRHWLQPVKLKSSKGHVSGIELEYTQSKRGKLSGTGNKTTIPADQVFRAIGQSFSHEDVDGDEAPVIVKGRIKTGADGRTSLGDVWAGGDCTDSGEDLTVTAVAQGRDAAESISQTLKA